MQKHVLNPLVELSQGIALKMIWKKKRNLISILYSAFKTHVITCSDLGIYLLSLKTKWYILRCKSKKIVCTIYAISSLKMHKWYNRCITGVHVIKSERNHYSIAFFGTFLTWYMHGHILGVPISLQNHQQVLTITNINLENGDTCDDV